ncbi:MAG: hypothetical protein ACPG5U_01295 [Planktomarina sp.]
MQVTEWFTLIGASAAALLIGQTAVGQTSQCANRDVLLSAISTKYGETRRSIALGQNNSVIEVFASNDTGTWTITVTTPAGMMCMVASGQAYEQIAVTDVPDV